MKALAQARQRKALTDWLGLLPFYCKFGFLIRTKANHFATAELTQ